MVPRGEGTRKISSTSSMKAFGEASQNQGVWCEMDDYIICYQFWYFLGGKIGTIGF